jgi:hypothetical protein
VRLYEEFKRGNWAAAAEFCDAAVERYGHPREDAARARLLAAWEPQIEPLQAVVNG